MKPETMQKTIVVLLAIASLGTMAMVTMLAMNRRGAPPANPSNGTSANVNTSANAGVATMLPVGGVGGDAAPPSEIDPPVLAQLPAFSLTERAGSPISLADLRGKAWIACFIFTNCHGPCPMMTSQMYGLQDTLKKSPGWDRIRLVSISVDPARDTPEALREYARLAHADETHWLMLTGERSAIWSLSKDGFKLPVGDNDEDKDMPIFHSQKFVLVDGVGRIRGYYDGLKADGRAKLAQDLDRVLAEKP